jgi:hypothetical protein
MAKKSFSGKINAMINPATAFLSEPDAPANADQPKGTKKAEDALQAAGMNKKPYTFHVDNGVLEDLKKIAVMKQMSVTRLMNEALHDFCDAESGTIRRYKDTFHE